MIMIILIEGLRIRGNIFQLAGIDHPEGGHRPGKITDKALLIYGSAGTGAGGKNDRLCRKHPGIG
jgi:hypothetical protein